MAKPKLEETYYDILKVDRKATVAEIVNAYHSAKNAFSKDSVATYSLFSQEETRSILEKLEEAYHTLASIEKRSHYDRIIAVKPQAPEPEITIKPVQPKEEMKPVTMPETFAPPLVIAPVTNTVPAAPMASTPVTETPAAAEVAAEPADTSLSGTALRDIREKRGLSIEDVARITKIPTRFIRAIEGNDPKGLPARVYLQGFVKNLAALYKLDPQGAVKSYLQSIDSKTPEIPKS